VIKMSQNGQKPILIAGAGLATLLLAQSLLKADIPFLIYEKDKSISFRAQGYRLRLSSEGLSAIESVLPPEKWQKFWDTCGKTGGSGFGALNAVTGEELEETRVDPESNRGPLALTSRDGKIVGIARGEMRKLFLKGCESAVHWNHDVTGYELLPDGVKLLFADGSKSAEGAMLVGGEGIYSKVARQLSHGRIKVFDTGARGIHGQAPTTAFAQLGEGVWRMVDRTNPAGNVFCITNVRSGDMQDPDIEFGWTMGAVPGVIHVKDFSIIGKPAADLAKSLTAHWAPKLKPLFQEMNVANAAYWKITCSSPSGVPFWENVPRVTVIGDAAHSMTPAGGNGANTAVRDSALLGKLIVEAGGFAEGVTAAYEREMRVYGSAAVKASYAMAAAQFGVTIDEETSPTV
jgi:2-polyprenyl-6-methoxyphenol hydroxylase-like FAD-dependent oxidoreductase